MRWKRSLLSVRRGSRWASKQITKIILKAITSNQEKSQRVRLRCLLQWNPFRKSLAEEAVLHCGLNNEEPSLKIRPWNVLGKEEELPQEGTSLVPLSGRRWSQRVGKEPGHAGPCRSRKEFGSIPEHRGKPLKGLKLEVTWVWAESLVLSGELNGGVQEGQMCWKAVMVWRGRGGGSVDRVGGKEKWWV